MGTIVDYVTSVHLKDSTGVFGGFEFPTLGAGIVDFPAMFALMDHRTFAGPYTMELEGERRGALASSSWPTSPTPLPT